jgi:predicted Zn finger-like uncharacterized protein
MQIVCPNCNTAYQVDAAAVGASGRSVRCARCKTVWFATDTSALQEIASAHRAEMAQFAGSGPDATEWGQPGSGEESIPNPADGAALPNVGYVDDAPPLATSDSGAPGNSPVGNDLSVAPLVESPALAPSESEPAPGSLPLAEDIETVAARRAREAARNRRLRWPGLPTAILGLILLDLGLIGWRTDIVRIAPQTASLYAAIGLEVNLRGLVLAKVTTTTQTIDGVPVLQVQGQIVSTAKRTVAVPRLRFAVRNAGGNEIYAWTALPTRSLLSPGEALDFASRLASPPPETHDVLVRFFNRHDLGIGIE